MSQVITPILILRRFLLWLLICSLSAAPSFMLAQTDGAHALGMAAGVMLFVLGYTAFTCTGRFQRFYERPFMRSTLRFGYGVRLLLSAVGAATLYGPQPFIGIFAVVPDGYCGIASAMAGSAVLGMTPQAAIRSFHGAMLITCLQGALLNVIVFGLMALFYPLRKTFGPAAPELQRGFEVVQPLALPAEPVRRADP